MTPGDIALLITATSAALATIGAGVKYLLDRADKQRDQMAENSMALAKMSETRDRKVEELVDLFKEKVEFDADFFGQVEEEMRSFHGENRNVIEGQRLIVEGQHQTNDRVAEVRTEVRDGNRVVLDRIAEVRQNQSPARRRRSNQGDREAERDDVAA